MRLRHDSEIKSVAITADGKNIASLADDGVRVWQADTGQQLGRILPAPKAQFGSAAYAMALFPRSNTLAIVHGTGRGISLWDLPACKEIGVLEHKSTETYYLLAISVGGNLLATVCQDLQATGWGPSFIKVWDAKSRKEVKRLPFIDKDVFALALSPDCGLLAVATFAEITVFDLNSAKMVYKVQPAGGISQRATMTFSPDGAHLVYSVGSVPWRLDGDALEVRLAKDGTIIKGNARPGGDVAFDALGKTMVVVSRGRGSVAVYAGAVGSKVQKLDLVPSQCVALESTGRTLVLADRNRIHVRDLNCKIEKPLFLGHRRYITSLNYTSDGKWLASHAKDSPEVLIWDANSGKPVRQIREAFTPTARYYYNGNFTDWQANVLSGIPAVAFSPETGVLAMANSEIGVAQLWSASKGRLVKQLKKVPSDETEHWLQFFRSLAFSANGRFLAATDLNDTVAVWDTLSSKQLWQAREQRPLWGDYITGLALSPNAELFAIGFSGKPYRWNQATVQSTIILRDAATGNLVRELPTTGAEVTHLAFSPDGKLLISVQPGFQFDAIALWHVDSGKQLTWQDQPKQHVWAGYFPCFSPDGRLVAAFSDGPKQEFGLHWWEVDTGSLVGELRGNIGASPIAFSPRGTTMAVVETEQSVLLVDMVGAFATDKQAANPPGLEQAWSDLASANAGRAYRAMAGLARYPGAVAFLGNKLSPIRRPKAANIEESIAMLDADQIKVREQASEKLVEIGDDAVPFLKKTLADNPPLEVRQRIPLLMKSLEKRKREFHPPVGASELQQIRAIQVLLWIGNADAVTVLTRLADGASAARQTQDTKTALKVLRLFTK